MKTHNYLLIGSLMLLLACTDVFAAAGVATTISSISITSTPTVPATGYATGEVIKATVVFSAAETVTGTPSLELDIGGNIRVAEYISGSGTTSLVFAYTVVAGDSDTTGGITIVSNSLATNSGSISNGSSPSFAATITPTVFTTNTQKVAGVADTTPPIFRSAVGSGYTVTISYDEIGSGLNAAIVPAVGRFAFTKNGGTSVTITGVSIDHAAQTVSLTLNGLIALTDTDMKVSYISSGTNDMQDVAGNKVANFVNAYVANAMPTFNVQGNYFVFDTPTAKIGNGTAIGDKILYSNVIGVNGQSIDAVVTTVNIVNTTISSADGVSGTQATALTGTPTQVDKNWYKLNTTGTGSNGYVEIRFDFIKSGTYGTTGTTSTGADVLLQNVALNSYDIDGYNGSYQFQEFGGFATYTVSPTTRLAQTQQPGFTHFQDTNGGNNTTGAGTQSFDDTRVMAMYDSIHSFSIKTGQTTNQLAYYYIDFSKGPDWVTPAPVYEIPTVNPKVTNNTLPTVTGTFVGTVANSTDTAWKVVIIINGVTYTASTRNDVGNTATITGSGITATFDKTTGAGTWSMTVSPTALAQATYDVGVTVDYGPNLAGINKFTTDNTTNELVINGTPADTTPPTLTSFARLNPLGATIAPASLVTQNYVDFTATFSEAITNVDVTDFLITGTASAGLSVSSVTQSGTSTYTVRISNIPTNATGTLNLDLAVSNNVVDLAGNSLVSLTPTGVDETYTISSNSLPVATPFTNSASLSVAAGPTDIDTPTGTDSDGTIINVTIVTLPNVSQGTLYLADGVTAVTANQVLTTVQAAGLKFDPSGTFVGNSTFTFTVTDNNGGVSASAATATIPISNSLPVATPFTNSASLSVAAGPTDIDTPTGTDSDGTIINVTIVTLPNVSQGTLYLADGVTAVTANQVLTTVQAAGLKFDPSGTFVGNSTFTFTVTDNNGGVSASAATATIPISNSLPVATPFTNSASLSVAAGPTDIDTPTGTDSDGTIINVTIVTLPNVSQGTLYLADGVTAVTANQVLTTVQAAGLKFDPSGTFVGNSTFTFTVTDNNGGVSASAATATIPISNSLPVATPFTNSASLSVAAGPTDIDTPTGTDSDGTIINVTIVTLPNVSQGTLYLADGVTAVTANQVLTVGEAAGLKFDPSGTFVGNSTFTFTVTDNNGGVSASAATATIPVVIPPGITINPISGLTTTGATGSGHTATFTAVLTSQPTADVTVPLHSSDTVHGGTVDKTSLTFTTADWNIAQTVTVAGVDDFTVNGPVSYSIVTDAATIANGTDTNYNGMNAADVAVTNLENDVAGITVTPASGLTTTGAGGAATFTVALNTIPTANVIITPVSSNPTQGGVVSPSSLTFTTNPSSNWNIPQTVTVTGVDDGIVDGNIGYSVTATAGSSDTYYDGLSAIVSITNIENDILPAPGGVPGYLPLWLKADAGIGVADAQPVGLWTAQSFNSYIANNSGGDGQTPPTFLSTTDNMNFNPVVKFNGTTDGLDLADNYIYSANYVNPIVAAPGMTMFAVVQPSATQATAKAVLDFGNDPTAGYGFSYGTSTVRLYTPTSYGGVDSTKLALTPDNDPVIMSGEVAFGANQNLYLNGTSVYDATHPVPTLSLSELTASEISASATHDSIPADSLPVAGPLTIGRQSKAMGVPTNLFAGKIPEVIIYNADLSATNRDQVQSYLALKYGITLETNYLASDGSTIWAVGNGYDFDIAGIGRDDNSGLMQPKSKSSNSDALVTVDGSSLSTDKAFLIWGNNNGTATYTSLGAPAGEQIMDRVWKVANIGNVGTVMLSTTDTSATALLVDADGDFKTSATSYPLSAGSVSNVTLANGNYFTFDAPPTGPDVITMPIATSAITSSTATLKAQVNDHGANTAVSFQYGLTSSYGATVTSATVLDGVGSTLVYQGISGLNCNTLYHYQAMATNSSSPKYSGGAYIPSYGGDQTFVTSVCPPVFVTYPTAGATWIQGSNYTITWTGFTGSQVRIDLYSGGSLNRNLAMTAVNSGSFTWNVLSTQAAGGGYSIRVTSATNSSQYADSGAFTISAVPTAPPPSATPTVTYPNTVVTWKRGSNYVITWTGFPGSQVRIYLYKSGSLNRTLANPATNSGSFTWNVVTTQTVGTDYKIRVNAVSTTQYDDSNSNFTIQ